MALAALAVCRPTGGLTSCLQTIGRALEYDLKSHVRWREENGMAAQSAKDARLIELWCGSTVWKKLVKKALKGLKYIFEHRDDEGFLE